MKLTRVTTKTEQGGWGAHAFRVAGQQSGSGNAEHLLFIHHAGEGKGGTWSFAGPAGRLLWSPELELTLTETSLINQLLFWHGTSGSPAKCPKTHNKNFVLFPHRGLKLRCESSQWGGGRGRQMRPSCAYTRSWGGHAKPIPSTHTALELGLEELPWKTQLSAVSWQQAVTTVILPPSSKRFETPRWKSTSSAKYFCL